MPLATLSHEPRSRIFDFVEEKVGLGLWVWDYKTSRMQWSRGMFKLLKLDSGSVEPSLDAIRNMIHPDDRLNMSDLFGMIDRQFQINRELRIVLPDRRVRWVQNYGELVSDPEGKSRMVGYLLDVTSRKEKEIDLAYLKNRTDALRQNADVSFWTASLDGRRVNNPQWEQWTGQPAQEASDFGWLNCIHPDDRARVETARMKSLTDRQPFIDTYRIRFHDQRYRQVISRAALVMNEVHKNLEWAGVIVLQGEDEQKPYMLPITGAQVRAARAILGWSASDLADRSVVSLSSIRRIEDYDGVTQTRDTTLNKIREAFEKHGIEFVGTGPDDYAVRRRPAAI